MNFLQFQSEVDVGRMEDGERDGELRADGEHREKENMKGVCNVFMNWFLVLLTRYGGDASEICIMKSFSDPCLLSPLGEQYSLGV